MKQFQLHIISHIACIRHRVLDRVDSLYFVTTAIIMLIIHINYITLVCLSAIKFLILYFALISRLKIMARLSDTIFIIDICHARNVCTL